MTAALPALSVAGLTVGYGKAEAAVEDVSLEVAAGELVTVLGANGAGKTTLLMALAGLLPLRAGSISLSGRAVDRVPAHRRAVDGLGLALEGHQVIEQLSVEDNLRLALHGHRRRLGRSGTSARMQQAWSLFDVLPDRRRDAAGSLSGGQQQMLVLARLFITGAPVLLLDEPSLGLAPAVIDEVYDRLTLLRGEGRALVVVEQDAARALNVSDRVHVLRRGRLLEGSDRLTRDSLSEAYLST